MAIPVSADLDFQNVSQIINYPGGFPPPSTNKFATTIGNGSATSFTIPHPLNTTDVLVQLRHTTSALLVQAEVEVAAGTQIIVRFSSPPAANAIRVVILA